MCKEEENTILELVRSACVRELLPELTKCSVLKRRRKQESMQWRRDMGF